MTDLQNDLTGIQINDRIDENTNPQDPIRVKKPKESLKRTVVKAIFWRIIAILSTLILAAWLYNDLQKATYLAVIDNIIKFILHFIFELSFNRWKWGIIMG
jgi:uncharacterized membrane protein|tara:strand:- start:8457 stop:8759 length:303 start_codon:yes stop_codon:yes gene_type:complete